MLDYLQASWFFASSDSGTACYAWLGMHNDRCCQVECLPVPGDDERGLFEQPRISQPPINSFSFHCPRRAILRIL